VTGGSPLRLLYSSRGPWEVAFGYSRVIRTGDRIMVSGCTAVVDGAVRHVGEAGAQMAVALDCVLEAVRALGGTRGDVIRTRTWSTEPISTPWAGCMASVSLMCARRRP